MLLASLESLPPSPASAREGFVIPASTPATPALAEAAAAPAVAPDALASAVVRANQLLHAITQALEFEYDTDVDKTVVRLVDVNDRHVVRQVPAPELLDITRGLDRMQAVLFRTKA